MATESLSPSDRSSLQAERGPVNMAVAAALVFERHEGTSYDAVAERVANRLHLVPRYRQKLDMAPLGIANPVWIDDEGFDVHWHLRPASLPRPGTHAQLADYLAREMSRRLDRSRPLWELHVVEGLEGGRTALIPKMHHALVDGMAAVGIGMVLLDPTPEPLPIEAEDWSPRTVDPRSRLTRLARSPLSRAQKLLVDSTLRALETSPRRAAEDVMKATELVTELARQRPQAPMTPLNHTISPNRRAALRSAALGDIRAVGKAHGATINDVIMTTVTGMLGHLLGTDKDLVALVPVSVRKEGVEGGNHISTVFVDLPVTEPDPLVRMASIGEQMRALKASAAVRAGAILVGATGQAPPLVSSMMVRAMGNVRAMNLVVSNVPGPQQPFFMNGARMEESYPAVPLNPPNQGLSIGILSYDGEVFFGLLADSKLDPPVEAAADALDRALDEVLAL